MTFETIKILCARPRWRSIDARPQRTGQRGVLFELQTGSGDWMPRFCNALETAAVVPHPLLPPLLETDLEATLPWALFGVPSHGQTLRQVRARAGGVVPPDIAVALVMQVAEALAALHAAGQVHGWFGLDTVWVAPDGSIRLLFAGIAELGEIAGRSGCRGPWALARPAECDWPPEAIQGAPSTGATDIYRAGLLLHDLITGALPFARESQFAHLRAVASTNAPPLPASLALASLCAQMLARDPHTRPQDGVTLRGRLEAALAQEGPESAAGSRPTPADRLGTFVASLP